MGIRDWCFCVAVVAAGSDAGCALDNNFGAARFHCDVTADCPAGQLCTAGYCEVPAAGTESADAGPGAAPERADATSTSQTLVLLPVADAYVDSAQPDANLGASDELRADGIPSVVSYLAFEQPEDFEERYLLEGAALEVYANASHATGYQVSIVDGPAWSESSVTYLNAPAKGGEVGSSGPLTAGSWTEVDLASIPLDGDFESFALTTEDETALSLASREADDHAPRLVLTVSVR